MSGLQKAKAEKDAIESAQATNSVSPTRKVLLPDKKTHQGSADAASTTALMDAKLGNVISSSRLSRLHTAPYSERMFAVSNRQPGPNSSTNIEEQEIRFEKKTLRVWEDVETMYINIVRKDTQAAAKIRVLTIEGSAKTGVNFSHLDKEVHFASGEERQTVALSIFNDPAVSGNISFTVRMMPCRGQSSSLLNTTRELKVCILDSDSRFSSRIRSSKAFGRLVLTFTVFALFAHDIWLMSNVPKEYDNILGVVTVFCFLIFAFEWVINALCLGKSYAFSAPGFLDLLALFGVLILIRLEFNNFSLDLSIILLNGAELARTASLARIAGRAGRATRIPKLLGQSVACVIDMVLLCIVGAKREDKKEEAGNMKSNENSDAARRPLDTQDIQLQRDRPPLDKRSPGSSRATSPVGNDETLGVKSLVSDSKQKRNSVYDGKPDSVDIKDIKLRSANDEKLVAKEDALMEELMLEREDDKTEQSLRPAADEELPADASRVGGMVLEVLTSKIMLMMLILLILVATLTQYEDDTSTQREMGLEMLAQTGLDDGLNGTSFNLIYEIYTDGDPPGTKWNEDKEIIYLKINGTEFISDAEKDSLRRVEMDFTTYGSGCGDSSVEDLTQASCLHSAIFNRRLHVFVAARNGLILTICLTVIVTLGMAVIAYDFQELVFAPIGRIKVSVERAFKVIFGELMKTQDEEEDDSSEDSFNNANLKVNLRTQDSSCSDYEREVEANSSALSKSPGRFHHSSLNLKKIKSLSKKSKVSFAAQETSVEADAHQAKRPTKERQNNTYFRYETKDVEDIGPQDYKINIHESHRDKKVPSFDRARSGFHLLLSILGPEENAIEQDQELENQNRGLELLDIFFPASLKTKWTQLLIQITTALVDIEKAFGVKTGAWSEQLRQFNSFMNSAFKIRESAYEAILEGRFSFDWLTGTIHEEVVENIDFTEHDCLEYVLRIIKQKKILKELTVTVLAVYEGRNLRSARDKVDIDAASQSRIASKDRRSSRNFDLRLVHNHEKLRKNIQNWSVMQFKSKLLTLMAVETLRLVALISKKSPELDMSATIRRVNHHFNFATDMIRDRSKQKKIRLWKIMELVSNTILQDIAKYAVNKTCVNLKRPQGLQDGKLNKNEARTKGEEGKHRKDEKEGQKEEPDVRVDNSDVFGMFCISSPNAPDRDLWRKIKSQDRPDIVLPLIEKYLCRRGLAELTRLHREAPGKVPKFTGNKDSLADIEQALEESGLSRMQLPENISELFSHTPIHRHLTVMAPFLGLRYPYFKSCSLRDYIKGFREILMNTMFMRKLHRRFKTFAVQVGMLGVSITTMDQNLASAARKVCTQKGKAYQLRRILTKYFLTPNRKEALRQTLEAVQVFSHQEAALKMPRSNENPLTLDRTGFSTFTLLEVSALRVWLSSRFRNISRLFEVMVMTANIPESHSIKETLDSFMIYWLKWTIPVLMKHAESVDPNFVASPLTAHLDAKDGAADAARDKKESYQMRSRSKVGMKETVSKVSDAYASQLVRSALRNRGIDIPEMQWNCPNFKKIVERKISATIIKELKHEGILDEKFPLKKCTTLPVLHKHVENLFKAEALSKLLPLKLDRASSPKQLAHLLWSVSNTPEAAGAEVLAAMQRFQRLEIPRQLAEFFSKWIDETVTGPIALLAAYCGDNDHLGILPSVTYLTLNSLSDLRLITTIAKEILRVFSSENSVLRKMNRCIDAYSKLMLSEFKSHSLRLDVISKFTSGNLTLLEVRNILNELADILKRSPVDSKSPSSKHRNILQDFLKLADSTLLSLDYYLLSVRNRRAFFGGNGAKESTADFKENTDPDGLSDDKDAKPSSKADASGAQDAKDTKSFHIHAGNSADLNDLFNLARRWIGEAFESVMAYGVLMSGDAGNADFVDAKVLKSILQDQNQSFSQALDKCGAELIGQVYSGMVRRFVRECSVSPGKTVELEEILSTLQSAFSGCTCAKESTEVAEKISTKIGALILIDLSEDILDEEQKQGVLLSQSFEDVRRVLQTLKKDYLRVLAKRISARVPRSKFSGDPAETLLKHIEDGDAMGIIMSCLGSSLSHRQLGAFFRGQYLLSRLAQLCGVGASFSAIVSKEDSKSGRKIGNEISDIENFFSGIEKMSFTEARLIVNFVRTASREFGLNGIDVWFSFLEENLKRAEASAQLLMMSSGYTLTRPSIDFDMIRDFARFMAEKTLRASFKRLREKPGNILKEIDALECEKRAFEVFRKNFAVSHTDGLKEGLISLLQALQGAGEEILVSVSLAHLRKYSEDIFAEKEIQQFYHILRGSQGELVASTEVKNSPLQKKEAEMVIAGTDQLESLSENLRIRLHNLRETLKESPFMSRLEGAVIGACLKRMETQMQNHPGCKEFYLEYQEEVDALFKVESLKGLWSGIAKVNAKARFHFADARSQTTEDSQDSKMREATASNQSARFEADEEADLLQIPSGIIDFFISRETLIDSILSQVDSSEMRLIIRPVLEGAKDPTAFARSLVASKEFVNFLENFLAGSSFVPKDMQDLFPGCLPDVKEAKLEELMQAAHQLFSNFPAQANLLQTALKRLLA